MDLLTATQVARHIGVCRKSLYNMIDDGRFNVPPLPDLLPRKWRLSDVERWKKRGPRAFAKTAQ